MNPGRELDAKVAELVYGKKVADTKSGFGRTDKHAVNPDGSYTVIPHFSTHIAAAWEIRNKVKIKRVTWIEEGKEMAHYGEGENDFAIGETAAHAICLAALKAVEQVSS